MSKFKRNFRLIIITIMAAVMLFTAGCSGIGKTYNPVEDGYDCMVVYDALGGLVNSRKVRETFYKKDSYVFKPSGTTNMLIQPVKDGYILTGWYTAKEDITDANGNVTGYSFKAEDRWDFDEDRVQESMTLYARWIEQGKVNYIDASSNNVMFSKNITAESPVQRLSGAAEMLIKKEGHSFLGYFSDKECTTPYDFSQYIHSELVPSNEVIYAQLQQEFPEYIETIEFTMPEELPEEDTSDLFVNKLGYDFATDDPAIRAQIHARKDEIIEASIDQYELNTSDKMVYLGYIKGNYARILKTDNLKIAGKYAFTGKDAAGKDLEGYIIADNLDFDGIKVEVSENFTGKIYGNGFSLKNITINVVSRKLDFDERKSVGLFQKLNGAYIENVVFENFNITLGIKSGIPVTVGALSVEAKNSTLKNLTFNGLNIKTGNGDDGAAKYVIGDLFAPLSGNKNNKLENVTGSDVVIEASEHAEVSSIFIVPVEELADIDNPGTIENPSENANP
ncbi:MAG: InlB B-repeat-containing protein [Eubacteriales bacterium]|nr:InlB B-repeat-containing protein [Eubacteriales bacterium]